MDGDGSGFAFPSTSDYSKGQDATDISWADIFLDGIHSDDPGTTEAGGIGTDTSSLGASIHGTTQQLVQQPQTSMVGGQLQINIPTHLQGSLTSNAVQQASTNLCGTVAYLAPSASTQQQVGTAGRIQNVMTVAGQHQMAASVGQQQHQGSAKLVQIASSFPMASVQQLANSVPLQTLLQSNQTLAGQAIYGGQGTGLFPAQGSVHIENPKVVNVNFGPHVIGSDGSGQQAIIQTAEGKRVLITNSQLQHMPQTISLTQPLVGTQLINSVGRNVIRASMAPGTHTIVPVSTTGTQQIVLPSGQTVIPRQVNAPQGGLTKNVVLRPLNPNMSPVILNQGTIMNLINNQGVISGTGNQIAGLVPGQNIFVNGQLLNLGQLSGLAMPQLQVQHNPQGGVTLTNINAAQFQPTTQQLVIQHNGQQQHMLLQPKTTQSAPLLAHAVQSQSSGLLGNKNNPTPTSNANSASSTPVLTPTPSTPTPTPTPDLMSDSCDSGGKSSQGINILEQALAMSAIDLQSFGNDFNFLDNADCFSSVTTPPPLATPIPPLPKPKLQPTKSKSKTSKLKSKAIQPIVNVTVNSSTVPLQQPTAQLLNAQGQKVTISPQQKIITADGQVYVLSANGQQFILQPSANSSNAVTTQLKQVTSVASTAGSIKKTNVSIPTSSHLQIKDFNQVADQSSFSTNLGGQLKLSSHNIPVSVQQKHQFVTANSHLDNKIFIKASSDGAGTFKIETPVQSAPAAQIMFTTVATINNSPSSISQTPTSQTLTFLNEPQMLQIKNQKITTLSGTFFKQEPQEQLVKQEPVIELPQSVSHTQDLPDVASSMTNLSHTLAPTTSSIVAMATPLVLSSASLTAVTTAATTQSHQVTVTSTNQMVGSRQITVSTPATSLPYSSTLSDKSSSQSYTVGQSQSTPMLLHTFTSTAPSTASTTSKSNSKEKDPANIKSMIPIKIADSTLMLSLTPGQKERLESQLARMSKKDQEGLLMYQQNIIRRSQQVQQKQLEQQMKQKKLLQQQQEELQQHLQQPQELRQLQQAEQVQQSQQLQQPQQQMHQLQLPLQQQQSQQQLHQQTHSPALKLNHPVQVINRSELLSPQTRQMGLPTTIQELREKPEQQDGQPNIQLLSTIKMQEPPLQMHQTPTMQQQQLQQHQIHSNLQQRVPPLDHSGDPLQQMLIPQLGRCLAEQQLLRDRSLALSPDVNTPFKSFSDAMRRLVRYHTLQDHKPEEDSKTMKTWDTRYSKLCDYLVKKKRCYMRRFSKMQLYRDMCPDKQPENIQNLMCFNEQLRELIETEKEKAKTHPDLFEPINPGHLSFSHNCLTTTTMANIDSTESDKMVFTEFKGEDETDPFRQKYFAVKEISTDPDTASEKTDSPDASPSCKKRKLPDKGSSGTLKLVLKRRTTDNFIVKKSLANMNELSKDFKPVVNVEKSDSEYEFDPQTTNVACNQPVIVRRRTLSIASQQTSSDASSDNGSSISQTDKMQDHSSVEEDLEEERDEDDEEEVVKSSSDDEVQDSDIDNDHDDSCSVSADAFMETDEMVLDSEVLNSYKMGTTDVSGHSLFRYADGHGTHLERIGKKSSYLLSNNVSVTSGDVFNSSLSYPLTDSPSAKSQHEYGNVCLNETRRDTSFSFQTNTVGNSFSQSCTASSSTQDEEYMSESSVSNMEKEAARKGLPSSAIFTTPNKSLLETDAMFISDDDEEVRGGRRMVSSFEIDNKDPQSSMINESVRSAINSVLDGDDDDDDNEDSQASWTSAAHRPSSSSVHRNLFHSSSVPRNHDADLDAAVQSILN